MSEQRLIGAEQAKETLEHDYAYAAAELLDEVPTIDPETLPIVQELREKLERYETAEQEGRLVEFSCEIGTYVFSIRYDTKQVYECKVVGFTISEYGTTMKMFIFEDDRFTITPDYEYGKTVFLTREEAEAALKERDS